MNDAFVLVYEGSTDSWSVMTFYLKERWCSETDSKVSFSVTKVQILEKWSPSRISTRATAAFVDSD